MGEWFVEGHYLYSVLEGTYYDDGENELTPSTVTAFTYRGGTLWAMDIYITKLAII